MRSFLLILLVMFLGLLVLGYEIFFRTFQGICNHIVERIPTLLKLLMVEIRAMYDWVWIILAVMVF